MVNESNIIRVIRRAQSSVCKWKVAALGLDKKGDLVFVSRNQPRLNTPLSKGSGIHAEEVLMARYGASLRTILVCRISRTGKVQRMDPCPRCAAHAAKLGIRIIPLVDVL